MFWVLQIFLSAVAFICAASVQDSVNEYKISYVIEDINAGSHKFQQETKKDDVLSGSCSIVEPTGLKGTVYCSADKINGLQTIVTHKPITFHAMQEQSCGVGAHSIPVKINGRYYQSVLLDTILKYPERFARAYDRPKFDNPNGKYYISAHDLKSDKTLSRASSFNIPTKAKYI